MFFVTGQRRSKAKNGFAADYCYVCRAARMFHVETVGTRRHFYMVSTGSLKAEHLESKCNHCGAIYGYPLDHWDFYEQSDELTAESVKITNPMLPFWLQERAEVEKRIVSGKASYNERMGLLWEAVGMMEYMAALKTTTGNYESITAVIGLVFIVSSVGAAMVLSGNVQHQYDYLWTVGGGLSLAVLLWRILAATRSHKFNAVNKFISRSMMRYHPTFEEIEQLRSDHPNSDLFRSIKARKILDSIEQYSIKEPGFKASSAHPH